eukprot:scaffold4659_cov125-Isochrysis_galbana.AAC.11
MAHARAARPCQIWHRVAPEDPGGNEGARGARAGMDKAKKGLRGAGRIRRGGTVHGSQVLQHTEIVP